MFPSTLQVYVAPGVTDLRKSIQGLSSIVECQFEANLFDQGLFCFCNRSKNLIKVLYWDQNGFCLLIKRLEKGRFDWPQQNEEVVQWT